MNISLTSKKDKKMHSLLKTIPTPEFQLKSDPKIPFVTHKIWLDLHELSENDLQHYLQWIVSCSVFGTSQKWAHYQWVINKDMLPDMLKNFAHPAIKIMEIDKDLPQKMVCSEFYQEAVNSQNFKLASNIARLELLNQFGGVYLEKACNSLKNAEKFNQEHHFYGAVDPESNLISNAVIGSCANHPVIQNALELIQRNMHEETAPEFLNNIEDESIRDDLITGAGVMTTAVVLSASNTGFDDTILPLDLFL